jgi:hypothetical protein
MQKLPVFLCPPAVEFNLDKKVMIGDNITYTTA